MKLLKKSFPIGVVLILSVLLFSCSKDDNASSPNPASSADSTKSPNTGNPSDSDMGHVSITVTGDIEYEKSGIANFSYYEASNIGVWELSFEDLGPQTFDVNLMMPTMGGRSQLEPGTYEIGINGNTESAFIGVYTDIIDGNPPSEVEYDTFGLGSGGTLVIETSNEDIVSGSFEFTAHSSDDDLDGNTGTIQVSGTFVAKTRDYSI